MLQGKTQQRFNVGDTRLYEQQFPQKDELVMVKVSRVTEMGAYVTLLEYHGLEGMILMSELSKRRIRSIKKLVRIGRHEVALVLRVDQEKGYIDLSKKRVSPEDIMRCEERFSKSKKVHQIMFHIAQKHEILLQDLNKEITWPLHKRFGHALDAFQDPDFATTIAPTLKVSPEIRQTLTEVVSLRLASHKMRMRARIDIYCYGYSGVDAVKDALTVGKQAASVNSEDNEVEIKLIAPPQYIIIISCTDKAEGELRLTKAIEKMISTVRSYEGGDGSQQGEFMLIGKEEERHFEELDDGSDSDSEYDSEEEEEEDEGMGRVEDMAELGITEEEKGGENA